MLDSGLTTCASVTVSPGDIDAFSKVMSAITSDTDALATELAGRIDGVSF